MFVCNSKMIYLRIDGMIEKYRYQLVRIAVYVYSNKLSLELAVGITSISSVSSNGSKGEVIVPIVESCSANKNIKYTAGDAMLSIKC